MELVKLLAEGKSIPRRTDIPERVFSENDNLDDVPPRGY